MNRKETYIRNITNRTINDLLYGREPIRIEKFGMPRNNVRTFFFMDFVLEEKCTWLGIEI